jgi:hypothetical protein
MSMYPSTDDIKLAIVNLNKNVRARGSGPVAIQQRKERLHKELADMQLASIRIASEKDKYKASYTRMVKLFALFVIVVVLCHCFVCCLCCLCCDCPARSS